MTELKDGDPRLIINTSVGGSSSEETTPGKPIREVQVTNDTQDTSGRWIEDEIESQMRGAALNRSACPRYINRFYGFAYPDLVHLTLGGVALAERKNGDTDVSVSMLECFAFNRAFAVDLVQKLVEWMGITPDEITFPAKNDKPTSNDEPS